MTMDRPLRIAQVLAAGPFGGLESVVRLLALGLVERGHDVDALVLLDGADDESQIGSALETAGVRVHRLAHGRSPLAERRGIRRALAALRPDVVHSHGYRADIQTGPGARAAGRPVVSTLHGFTGGGLKIRLYERLQLACLRRYDRCIAVSASIGARLRAAGIAADRIQVVQNAWAPLAPRLAADAARGALGLPPPGGGTPVIGWVGRLSAEKAPDVALAALLRIEGTRPMLCFVGDGPMRVGLERTARAAGLGERVVFAGPHADAARLFSAFDVLALSSHTEGTPMVLFEAMDAGVPIVATRVGGIPEVLDERCAWLVESASPPALANALEAALSDAAEAAARADRATRVLREGFSRAAWLDAHEALYTALCR